MKQIIPYALPFFLYLGTLLLPELTPIPLSASYPLGIIAVAASLFYFRDEYGIRFNPGIWQFMAGGAIAAAWILLEGHYPLILPVSETGGGTVYLAFRLLGSILVASAVEELFARGFIARYLLQKNWQAAPVGHFTALSFAVVAIFFALAHSRWLPALIAGIILNLLLIKEKSIGSTIMAHGLANLLVGAYAILTGSWNMW